MHAPRRKHEADAGAVEAARHAVGPDVHCDAQRLNRHHTHHLQPGPCSPVGGPMM